MDSSSLKRLLLDRIANMNEQLSLMKNQLQDALGIVRSKNETITALNQKLHNSQDTANESNPDPSKRENRKSINDSIKPTPQSDDKLSEQQHLARKLKAMQKFFKEYGIDIKGRNSNNKTTQKRQILYSPNFDRIITVIEELNDNASSERHVVRIDNQATFKRADLLNLTLYADGMQVENNPFRKYETPSVKEFFNDLEDGYYPMELKGRHPDGVIFKLEDKRNVKYEEAHINEFSKIKNKMGDGDKVKSPGGEKKLVKARKSIADESKSIRRTEQTKPPKDGKEVKIPDESASGAKTSQLETIESEEAEHAKEETKKNDELKTFFISDKSPAASKLMNVGVSTSKDIVSLPSVPKEIAPKKSIPKIKAEDSKKEKPPTVSTNETGIQTSTRNLATSGIQTSTQNLATSAPKSDLNAGPTNITNITYNEAPMTIKVTRKPSKTSTCSSCRKKKKKNVSSSKHESLCSCKKDNSYTRQSIAPQPTFEEKFGDEQALAGRSPWVSEYKEQFCLNAEKRFKKVREANGQEKNFKKSVPIANKKYSNFTFLGKRDGDKKEEGIRSEDQAVSEKAKKSSTSLLQPKKVVTLNKKTSERMLAIKISLAHGSVEYVANVYPEEPVGKLWPLLNLRENDYILTRNGTEDTRIDHSEMAKDLKRQSKLIFIRVREKEEPPIDQNIHESHSLSVSSLGPSNQTSTAILESKEKLAGEHSVTSVKSEREQPSENVRDSKESLRERQKMKQTEIRKKSEESEGNLGKVTMKTSGSLHPSDVQISEEQSVTPVSKEEVKSQTEKHTDEVINDKGPLPLNQKTASKSSLTSGKNSPAANKKSAEDLENISSRKKSLSIPDVVGDLPEIKEAIDAKQNEQVKSPISEKSLHIPDVEENIPEEKSREGNELLVNDHATPVGQDNIGSPVSKQSPSNAEDMNANDSFKITDQEISSKHASKVTGELSVNKEVGNASENQEARNSVSSFRGKEKTGGEEMLKRNDTASSDNRVEGDGQFRAKASAENETNLSEKFSAEGQSEIPDPGISSDTPKQTETHDEVKETGEKNVENRDNAMNKEATVTSLISQTTFEKKNHSKPEIETSAVEVTD